MKKILITGCAGFVGIHLVKRLLGMNFMVVGIDTFLEDHYLDQKRAEIKNLLKVNKNFKFFELDKREGNLRNLLKTKSIDYVVDFASKDFYYKEEDKHNYRSFLDVNVTGTANIFELARDLGAKKFIYGSNHTVYGNTKKINLTEKNIVPKPISPQGSSKLAAEKVIEFLSNYYKLPAINLRFFSVYGPYLPPHTAMYHYIERFYEKKGLEVYVDLSKHYRDYIYIDDVVQYIISSLDVRVKFQNINIATGTSHNLKEVAFKTAEILGMEQCDVKIKILKRGIEGLTAERSHANISRAIKLLNYKPQIDLDRGLRETINWYTQTKQYQNKYFN